jgi:hypothetical protein
VTYAQSHNTAAGSACKYAKNRCTNMEGCPQCAACTSEDKKEKDAKVAEVKKRNDKIWADAKAKKDAEQKAYQDKLDADNAEAKRKSESGNVLINGQKTILTKTIIIPKKIGIANDNTIMYGAGSYDILYQTFKGFKDEQGAILLENKDWAGTYNLCDKSLTQSCIKGNLGIVKIGDFKHYWEPNTYHYDIVNPKGEYLFNDKSIKSIEHINDGWLLIGNFNSQNNFLYNLDTKTKIKLENITEDPIYNRAIEVYLPLFESTIKFTNHIEHLEYMSEKVKKYLLKTQPSKVNENILSKYSFVLIHTNYGQASHLYDDNNYKPSSKVLLYCITKDGKLETITLK